MTAANVPYPRTVYTVGDLSRHIKNILENDEVLSGVWVQGEVTNFVRAASGHCYFSLKDAKAVLKIAMWAGVHRRVQFTPKNGDLIQVFGTISVYEPRGEYQMLAQDVRPAGVGALYEAYEKLKRKLQAEGLFDSERKIPLPFLPSGVGIVTSPTGSVIQDIFRVVRRRFPNMPLYLVPAKVQGAGSVADIVAGLQQLDLEPRVDVIILARGGGSLEDLWSFNEEAVARAIAAMKKPVISAVGHETDTTIADLVADQRAATPSVAGELVVPVKTELVRRILERTARLHRCMRLRMQVLRKRWETAVACRFLRRPVLLIAERRLRVDGLTGELKKLMQRRHQLASHRLELLRTRLCGVNPTAVLGRGYAMITDDDGQLVPSVVSLTPGTTLQINFKDGTAKTTVVSISAPERET